MLDGLPAVSDPELEGALIALIFRDAKAIEKLGNLDAEDLADPQLSAILAAAQGAAAHGQPVNAITLLPRLRGIADIDGNNGLDIVRSLTVADKPPSIEDICARLKTLSIRRKMGEYLHNVANSASDESLAPAAIVDDVAAHMQTFAPPRVDETPAKFIHRLGEEFIAYLESDRDAIEITTGFLDLDEATGGWHRGQFAILAGRPSMGKSTVALSSMLKTAQAGHGVLFFSLEMGKHELAARALSDLAYTDPVIAYSDLKPQRSEQYLARIKAAADRLKPLPLQIECKTGLSVEDIFAMARSSVENLKKQGKQLDVIFVDHLLKIVPSGRYAGQPVKELDEVSEAMCRLAKTLNVAVVGLHQLNRENEGRDNQRAMLSDLRGSGSLEQDADLVLFCYRPAYREERKVPETAEEREAHNLVLETLRYELELQIAKQRQGPTTNIELWCDVTANAVRNRGFR